MSTPEGFPTLKGFDFHIVSINQTVSAWQCGTYHLWKASSGVALGKFCEEGYRIA